MNFKKVKSIEKIRYKTVIKKGVSTYGKLIDKFNELGISKKEELTGSLAEYYCKELFGVKLNKNSNETGFDGYYKGKKIEIKGRTWNSAYFSFSKNKIDQFDWAFLVILDADYNLSDIFAVSKSVIKKRIPKGGTFNLSKKLIEIHKSYIKRIYTNPKYSVI